MTDVTPSDGQAAAIKAITDWYGQDGKNEFYLAGYAGTGKSTIAEIAIEQIREQHGVEKVRTAAYTGKAASVLRKKAIEGAQTIHSLIYSPEVDEETGELTFTLSGASDAADAELIVLDECSMVDEAMANDLCSFGKKILVMGDPGQLPPVNGHGSFTGREPDAFLRQIHRQVADSPILELATMARQGRKIPLGYANGNVRVVPLRSSTQEAIFDPETQVLCGVNRVRWHVTQLIRRHLGFGGDRPLPGERLICCKNNRKLGLFNGGLGSLVGVKDGTFDSYRMEVEMEDLRKPLEDVPVDSVHFANHFRRGEAKKLYIKGKQFEEFDWGYVLTTHKAQGSSWDHVTIIDDSGSFRENRDLWLYTALTRAETGLTLMVRQ